MFKHTTRMKKSGKNQKGVFSIISVLVAFLLVGLGIYYFGIQRNKTILVTYHISGGFVGIDDELVVYKNGTVQRTQNRSSDKAVVKTATISDNTVNELKNTLEKGKKTYSVP